MKKLPRFQGNIVRAGPGAEITSTRNFDEAASVLSEYARTIEEHNSGIEALNDFAKKAKRFISVRGAEHFNVLDYGARGGGVTDASTAFTAANAAAVAAGGGTVLVPPGTYLLSDNVTLSAFATLQVMKGGILSIASGKTLTINGPLIAGWYQIFSGSGDVVFASDSCEAILAVWFGALPSATDNTVAINKALAAAASTSDFRPGTCLLGGGSYQHTGQINIPQRNIIFKGAGTGSTRLKYTGTTFQNGVEIDTAGEGWIEWSGMELQCTGKGKYAFHTVNLNEGCKIDLSIRDYLGGVWVEMGYLSTLNLRIQATAWDAVSSMGISQANWETVYGTGSGPIRLFGMNACTVRLKTYRVGSIITGGVTPFSIMNIQASTGLDLVTPNLEWGFGTGSGTGDVLYDAFESGGTVYALRVTTALFLQYVVGTVSGLRAETMRFNNLVKLKGECNIIFQGIDDYGNYSAGDRFVNEAGHDAILEGYKCTDARAAGALFKFTDSGISAQQGWIVRSANMVYGKRYKQTIANGGASDDDENVIDTFAFSGTEKLGCSDDVPRTYNVDRLYIPKVLTGYAVTNGSMTNVAGNRYTPADAASIGDYIQITPGVMMLESGLMVDSKRGTAALLTTGLQTVFRLRPITASKWYRVFVNRAGSPYLVEYASDPVASPEGNWLAGFQTNGSTQITGLANNPRLAYDGVYTPNTLNVTLKGTAAPGTGYWRKGDRVENTSTSADNVLSWACTTAGSSGTWTPNYNASRRVIRVLSVSTTVVGNVGAGEDDLSSYTVPAGTLETNGDFLRIVAWGEFGANANNKQVKAYFDGHNLFATGSLALNGSSWRMDVTICRVDATNQRGSAGWVSSDTLLRGAASTTNPAKTLANALVFKLTGEATSNDDIVQRGMIVELVPGS